MTGFAFDLAEMSLKEVAAKQSIDHDVYDFGIDHPATKVPAVVAFDQRLGFSRMLNPQLWVDQLRASFAESLLRHEITNAVIYVEVRYGDKAVDIMHCVWYRYRYHVFTPIIRKNIASEYCHAVYRAVDNILDDLERIRQWQYSRSGMPPLSREGDVGDVVAYLSLKEEVRRWRRTAKRR